MPRRSDAKKKMVDAARQLIRERGYNATAISDVLERSDAPRGSVYFHFPGGKTQLVTEAADAHSHAQVQLIDRSAASAGGSAARFVEIYLDYARDGMVTSDYSRGCAVAPLVTEAPGELAEVSRRSFAAMADRLAFHFVEFGASAAAGRELAHAVLAGVEGAMLTARALRSPVPFDAVRAGLLSHVQVMYAGRHT